MISNRYILAATALLAVSGSCAAAGAHHYVANNGDIYNRNLGTQTDPWGNLQQAIYGLNPGDTLTIQNEYPIPSTLWISATGTAADRITINMERFNSTNEPRLVCQMAPTTTCLSANFSSFLTLDGLTVEPRTAPTAGNKTAAQLFLHGSDNIVVSNSTFRKAAGYAIWVGGCSAAHKCHPDNKPNDWHYDHAYRFEHNTFDSSWNTAMYLVNAEDATVFNNTINTVLAGDGIVFDGDLDNVKTGVKILSNTVNKVNGRTLIDNNPTDAIKVRAPSTGTLIQLNTVTMASGAGIYLIGTGADDHKHHTHAQIIQNTVTGVVQMNAGNVDPKCNRGGWPSALNAAHTDDVLIQSNTVYKNHGEGITLNTVTQGTVTQNNAHDNFGVNIYLNNASDSTIDRNIAINNPKLTGFYRCGASAGGVSMANETGEVPNRVTLRNNRITNNILANGRFGVNFYWADDAHYHPDSWLENTQILNNTVYRTQRSSVSVSARPNHNNNVIQGNIWVQGPSTDPVASIPGSGFTCLANLWIAATSWSSCASGRDVLADPLFVSESDNDFRLRAGSPAINAAAYTVTVPNPWHDYFGNVRGNSPWDIGAHEYQP